MASSSTVRIRSWVRGTRADRREGLLGYVSVHYGDLVLDSITLRRTADGRYALSFPERTSFGGGRHAIVRPVDDEARREIEREILRQLWQREDASAAMEHRP